MKKFIFGALLVLAAFAVVAQPAMAQQDQPWKIHGEVRWRGEYQNNASDFDDNTRDSADFFPYRVRIAAEGTFSHNVSAWIEMQAAGVSGVDSGAVKTGDSDVFNGEGVELYQGNVTLNQLWSKNFSLRLGRQEIVAGNELLLGDLDFYAGLSHDGAVGTWNVKKVNLMLWWTRPAQAGIQGGGPINGSLSPDNTAIAGQFGTQNFLGGYATWTWKKDKTFDVYLMGLDTKGTSNVGTAGVRFAHDSMAKNSFFWDVEVAQQFGDAAYGAPNSKAKGNVLEGWFGYNWKSGKNIHRIYGRVERASGNKVGKTDSDGFIPMFGDFHNRTGHGDWFVLANDPTNLGPGTGINGGTTGSGLQALSVAYTGYYNDRHEFGVGFWDYTLDQKNTATGNDKLGSAVDIWYGFNYSKNVAFTASLSQLSVGDALKDIQPSGASDDVRRLYGQARIRF
jgi:hypothetical protein